MFFDSHNEKFILGYTDRFEGRVCEYNGYYVADICHVDEDDFITGMISRRFIRRESARMWLNQFVDAVNQVQTDFEGFT